MSKKFITEADRERARCLAGYYSHVRAGAFWTAVNAEQEANRRTRLQKKLLKLLKKELRRSKFEDRYMVSDFREGWMARRKKAINDGKVLVETGEQFLNFLPHAMKREAKSYFVTGIFVSSGKGTPITEMVTANIETPILDAAGVVGEAVVKVGSDRYTPLERYTYAFINLHGLDEKSVALVRKADCTVCRVIEKVGGVTVEERFYLRLNGEEFHDLASGEVVERKTVLARKQADATQVMLRYDAVASTSSPGQEKQGSITLACQNLPGWNAWEHHNLMMHGAPNQCLKHYEGKELKLKEPAQLATRMAQAKPIVKSFKDIMGFCVVLDKIKDDLDNEYEDGFFRASAEYMADAMSDDRYTVMAWAVDGETAQARPMCVNKGLCLFQPQKHLVSWLRRHHVAVRVVAQDEMEGWEQDAFNAAVIDGEGRFMLTDEEEAAGFKHAAVVVVPSRYGIEDDWEVVEEMLDVLVDKNVCKTTFDLAMPLGGINILSFCHSDEELEEEANTSGQLLQSAMIADPYATLEWYARKSGNCLREIVEDVLTAQQMDVAPGELEGDLRLVAQRINPNFVRDVWAPYYQDILKKKVQGWARRNGRICSPIDGKYLKIVPDFGHEMGFDLLRYNSETGVCEVLAPAMEAEGTERAIGTKYPKQGHDELIKAVNVLKATLLERICDGFDRGVLTEEQKEELTHKVKALKAGSIMVPAVEELKNLLAGMDFDGDALVIYTDEELVEIIWKVDPVAVVIMKDEEYREYLREKKAATEKSVTA